MRLKPLRDQVVVVTGASSGIGLATARCAACEGASVFLIARNEQALARRCEELAQLGGRAAFAAQAALARFGRIDTWVNVAGVGIYAPLAPPARGPLLGLVSALARRPRAAALRDGQSLRAGAGP